MGFENKKKVKFPLFTSDQYKRRVESRVQNFSKKKMFLISSESSTFQQMSLFDFANGQQKSLLPATQGLSQKIGSNKIQSQRLSASTKIKTLKR